MLFYLSSLQYKRANYFSGPISLLIYIPIEMPPECSTTTKQLLKTTKGHVCFDACTNSFVCMLLEDTQWPNRSAHLNLDLEERRCRALRQWEQGWTETCFWDRTVTGREVLGEYTSSHRRAGVKRHVHSYFSPCTILSKEERKYRWGQNIGRFRAVYQGIKTICHYPAILLCQKKTLLYKPLYVDNVGWWETDFMNYWTIVIERLFVNFLFQNFCSRSKQSGDTLSRRAL